MIRGAGMSCGRINDLAPEHAVHLVTVTPPTPIELRRYISCLYLEGPNGLVQVSSCRLDSVGARYPGNRV